MNIFQRLFVVSLILFSLSTEFFAQTPPSAVGTSNKTDATRRVRTYDVQHYVLRSRFDRTNKTYFGDTTVQLKPLNGNFNQVVLDAVDLKFESVIMEPTGTTLRYTQTGEKVIINLDKAYSPADTISIRFKYSAKPRKGVYFVDGDENRPSQVWTQGEPEEAHHWFPSYDYPDDKATTEQFLTVPKEETAIANGELLETIENADGTKTFHYRMPVPHSVYLTSFVIGKYVRLEDKYKNISLGYYMYPGRENIARAAYGKTPDMMRVFEELTGVNFPFNKYDQTIVANFTFGGMENITATTMADTEIFATTYMPGEVMDLVSHELAHSWFGNLVTTKSWSELWLNEGFATFMEAAYREKAINRADYMRKIRQDANRAMAYDMTARPHHALFNTYAKPDDSLFDTTTYQKGGAVIHTLREQIGDAAFWKAVNIYLNRHKFDNVESTDLKRAVEEASGQDLTWFFNQWVYKAGFPQLNVKQVYNPRTQRLTLTISQIQKSDQSVQEAFILPIEAEITTARGMKKEILNIKQRTQTFSFIVDGKPTRLLLDKDEKIPLKTVKIMPLANAAGNSSK